MKLQIDCRVVVILCISVDGVVGGLAGPWEGDDECTRTVVAD